MTPFDLPYELINAPTMKFLMLWIPFGLSIALVKSLPAGL